MQVVLREITTGKFVVSLAFDLQGLPRTDEVVWLPNGLGWKIIRVDRFVSTSGTQEDVTLIVKRFEK